MSRIALTDVDQLPETIQDFMQRRGALNVFRLLANAPDVFLGWARMVDDMLSSATFSARIRELIIVRVAYLQTSRYELNQHVPLAQSSGLTVRQVDAIMDAGPRDAARFTAAEQAVLDLITELCATRQLRAETFAAAHSALGDQAITELLMIISCYYGLALVLNAVDLDIDGTTRLLV
jgi:4-carboxymuconolactone decarboxylase